ncbi:MAG: hypothetical protein KDA91_11640 [Planctomycetaceae bacterium]|nr:hypothetical protein [Planctomycetaceae bacterium]
MSYDLMVFDPSAAPMDREEFLAWCDLQNDQTEVFDPTRTEFSTPGLRSWLEEMLRVFPAMDGPYCSADRDDDPHLTDYEMNRTSIFACFAWSKAKSAYNAVMSIAEKHGIAVYEISDPGGRIWRPGGDGLLC